MDEAVGELRSGVCIRQFVVVPLQLQRIHIHRPAHQPFAGRPLAQRQQHGLPGRQKALQRHTRRAFEQHLCALHVGHALDAHGHGGKDAHLLGAGQPGAECGRLVQKRLRSLLRAGVGGSEDNTSEQK